MTVKSQVEPKVYDGDGVTTVYPVPFYFIANDDVKAIHRAGTTVTPWVEGTHYTLTGAGNQSGGSLTVKTSPDDYRPQAGETLTVKLDEAFTQPSEYPTGGPFPARTAETSWDRSTMQILQLRETTGRCLIAPETDGAPTLELPIESLRASKVLGFKADGSPTTYDPDDVSIESVTASGATTTRLVADRFAQVYEPEDFGAAGDGTTDDTAAIQAMLDAAPDGGACRFMATYKVTSGLTVIDKSITILGPGTLYQAADISDVLMLHSTEGSDRAIASITYQDSHDYGGSSNATVSSLSFASDPGLSVGDIVRVSSDDSIEGDNPAHLRGEFTRVGAVSGTTVYLNTVLRETYTTNPVCTPMNRAPRFVVDGLRFASDWTAGVANSWDSTYLQLTGAFHPEVRNVRMVDGYSIGVNITACVGAAVQVHANNFRNAVDTEGVAGYIVQDANSEGSYVQIVGTHCRHAYTTSAYTSPKNFLRGRTFGAVVTGTVVASSGAAFDTHSDAQGVTFVGCRTYGSYMGESSGGAGFQLRGRHNRCVGCVDHGSYMGFQVGSAYANDGLRNQFYQCAAYGNPKNAMRIDPGTGTLSQIEVVDFYAEPDPATYEPVRIDDSTDIYLGNIRIKIAPVNAGAGVIYCYKNSDVTIENLRVDWQDATTGTLRLISFGGTGNQVRLRGARITVGTGNWDAVVRGNNDAGDIAYFEDVRADKAPNTGLVTNWNASATYAGEILIDDGQSATTNYATQTVSAAGQTLDPSHLIGPVLTFDVTANNAASSITNIEDGVKPGQLLIVQNNAASSQDLDIVDGNQIVLKNGTTLILEPGESALFVWTGSVWQGIVGEQ